MKHVLDFLFGEEEEENKKRIIIKDMIIQKKDNNNNLENYYQASFDSSYDRIEIQKRNSKVNLSITLDELMEQFTYCSIVVPMTVLEQLEGFYKIEEFKLNERLANRQSIWPFKKLMALYLRDY